MEDVIIIGAGLSGLTAALELKRAGLSCRILEAGDSPGGRARTRILSSGVHADLGGHWLHGEGNSLKAEVERYGITGRDDQAQNLWIYDNGNPQSEASGEGINDAIDQKMAQAILSGTRPDCALPDLGVDAAAREMLKNFSLLWNGVQPPLYSSALEFLTDENTPGGLQLDGGMVALTSAMAAEIGPDRIHLRTSVTRIQETPDGVRIQAMDGSVWTARRAIFTASLGVLKSRLVSFAPPLSRNFHEHLDGLVMGNVNKIIVELDPDFVRARDISVDLSLELLGDRVAHFCHVNGAGQPLIQLFVCGDEAERVEALAPDQALDYVRDALSPVAALQGFEAHILSAPIVTRWVANPYTRGAYSCCLPGARRSGPVTEGLVTFCGEAFDERFPASLAGAYLSGKAGARIVRDELARTETVAEAV